MKRAKPTEGAPLSWLGLLPSQWRAHPVLPWGIGGLGFVLTLAFGLSGVYLLEVRERLQSQLQAQLELGTVRARFDRELGNVLAMPETLAVLISARGGELDVSLLRRMSERMLQINPHLRNIAFAPDDVIREVFPRAGNEAVVGLRYRNVPAQWDAVQRAEQTRRTVVTGPINLVQGGQGLASRTPVFVGDQGRERYWGIVSMIIETGSLFDAIGLGRHRQGHYLFGARRLGDDGQLGAVFAGEPDAFGPDAVTLRYSLPGGEVWILAARPWQGWGPAQDLPLLIYLLPLGASLALGLLSFKLAASHQRVVAEAMHDRLTGLANRRLFDDRLEMALSGARRYGHRGALLLLDLDRFKPVNDAYGHAAGDLLLRIVGQRLLALGRHSDTVARIGGDEFALILPELAQPEDALVLAERVRQVLTEPFVLGHAVSVQVDVCVGVAAFPCGSEEPDGIYARADAALYRGKRGGRGQVSMDGSCAAPAPHPGEAG